MKWHIIYFRGTETQASLTEKFQKIFILDFYSFKTLQLIIV